MKEVRVFWNGKDRRNYCPMCHIAIGMSEPRTVFIVGSKEIWEVHEACLRQRGFDITSLPGVSVIREGIGYMPSLPHQGVRHYILNLNEFLEKANSKQREQLIKACQHPDLIQQIQIRERADLLAQAETV